MKEAVGVQKRGSVGEAEMQARQKGELEKKGSHLQATWWVSWLFYCRTKEIEGQSRQEGGNQTRCGGRREGHHNEMGRGLPET